MTAHDIAVFDNVLVDPMVYRNEALAHPFETHLAGGESWKGMAVCQSSGFVDWLTDTRPNVTFTLSLLRQSPKGQHEPNFVHTDSTMGDWTAILYLSTDPESDDGTCFWRHRDTGAVESVSTDSTPSEQAAWRDSEQWELWHRVEAQFNRAVIFPARYFHSRSIYDNYGTGSSARLVQVVFGTTEKAS